MPSRRTQSAVQDKSLAGRISRLPLLKRNSKGLKIVEQLLKNPVASSRLVSAAENYERDKHLFLNGAQYKRQHNDGTRNLLKTAMELKKLLPMLDSINLKDFLLGNFNPMEVDLAMLAVCARNRNNEFFEENKSELEELPVLSLSQDYTLTQVSEGLDVLIAACEKLQRAPRMKQRRGAREEVHKHRLVLALVEILESQNIRVSCDENNPLMIIYSAITFCEEEYIKPNPNRDRDASRIPKIILQSSRSQKRGSK